MSDVYGYSSDKDVEDWVQEDKNNTENIIRIIIKNLAFIEITTFLKRTN